MVQVMTDSDQPITAPIPPAQPRRHRPRQTVPGLTGAGVVVLVTFLGVAIAAVDGIATGGLSWIFAAAFVIVCASGAVLVRHAQLAAAVITPPLVYVLACLVAAQLGQEPSSLKRLGLEAALMFATHAPALYLATGVAGAIALARVLSARRRG